MTTIFVKDGLRFNIHSPHTIDGVQYPADFFRDPDARAEHGITALELPPPPVPPEGLVVEEAFTRKELDIAPYEVFELRPQAELDSLLIDKYEAALDAHLDETALQHRYDNRFTFALRAGYEGPYKAEGVAFAQWMEACNTSFYTLLQEVTAGTRSRPTMAEFIASLPAFVKP